MFRILRERNADCVADAVGEQAADADGTLDAAVLAIPRFSHAEVDRVVPASAFGVLELVEAGDKKAVGLNHDLGIRRLHRENKIVVVEFAGDVCELERAFDHAERRVTEAVHDAVAQAAVVRADPHRDAASLAERHQRGEALADA